MRKHAFKFDVRQRGNFFRKGNRIVGSNSDTSHAGFNFQMNFCETIEFDGGGGNFFGKFKIRNRLSQIIFDDNFCGNGRHQSQNQNRHVETCAAKFQTFIDSCDRQKIRTALNGNFCNFNRTVPVSVCLNNGA